MELAIILVLLVVVELALTFYLVGRIRDYRRRVARLEKNMAKMAEVINGISLDVENAQVPASNDTLSDILHTATPEDIAQANALIESLGLGKD